MAKAKDLEEIRCFKCGYTEHTVLYSYKTSWNDDDHEVWGSSTHDFLKCNGCKRPTYRETSWFSEEPGMSVEYYPPRPPDHAPREPRDFDKLPYRGAVKSVYHQTINAFNAGCRTLAAAGVRLLVEGVCVDQKILKGKNYTDRGKVVRNKAGKIALRNNLEGKINGMRDKGHIGKNQAKVLHELRKLGNDAAHGLDEPSLEVIGQCIDAVEHIFQQVYEHPELLRQLTARTRPATKK